MKITGNSLAKFISSARFIVVGMFAALSATSLHSQPPPPPPASAPVQYSPYTQIEQGNMPFNPSTDPHASYQLSVTSPSTYPAGTTATVSLNVSLFAPPPAGVSNTTALSFVSISPMTLTFTGPGQTQMVTVTMNVPNGNWAGSYSYEILTSGWPAGLNYKDNGAFINANFSPPAIAGPGPSISILPVNQTVYTVNLGTNNVTVMSPQSGTTVINNTSLPFQIPYTIAATTPDGSPITSLVGNLAGSVLPINVTGLLGSTTGLLGNLLGGITGILNPGTSSVTATGSFTVTQAGYYTIGANTANGNGTAVGSSQITVNVVAPPPTVVVNTPADGSAFVIDSSVGSLSVPFTYTGNSTYSNISALSVTLNGANIASSVTGLGTRSATGSGNLTFTAAGTYSIQVFATDAYGQGTNFANYTVSVQSSGAPPTVTINAPSPGAIVPIPSGSTSVSVPFSFTGAATNSVITGLSATLDGNPITLATTGNGTLSANGTANLTITTTGNHTIAVVATNAYGNATTSEVINVTATTTSSSTLTVGITNPAPNAVFTLGTGNLSIPATFTASSTASGGVKSITATLNGAPLTLTASGLGNATAKATATLVVPATGNYTIAVTATDANGSTTTGQIFTVTSLQPSPCVTITAPCDGSSFTLQSSNCPTWVPVKITAKANTGFTISSLTLVFGASNVTLTNVSGLNTSNVTATANVQVTATGNYTLKATAVSSGVSATDTNSFKVLAPSGCSSGTGSGSTWGSGGSGYTSGWGGWDWNSWSYSFTNFNLQSPSPCVVNWEQSWDCNTTQKGGNTLPLCFHVQYSPSKSTSCWGNYFSNYDDDYYGADSDCRSSWGWLSYFGMLTGSTTSSRDCLNNNWDYRNGCTVSNDTSVKILVYEQYNDGSCGTPKVYTCGYYPSSSTYCIDGNDQYQLNVPTGKGPHFYRADVYYYQNGSRNPQLLGSTCFNTK